MIKEFIIMKNLFFLALLVASYKVSAIEPEPTPEQKKIREEIHSRLKDFNPEYLESISSRNACILEFSRDLKNVKRFDRELYTHYGQLTSKMDRELLNGLSKNSKNKLKIEHLAKANPEKFRGFKLALVKHYADQSPENLKLVKNTAEECFGAIYGSEMVDNYLKLVANTQGCEEEKKEEVKEGKK